jgi:Fe-S oxidoreductase
MSGLTNPPVTVGLIQINNSFSGQSYLPYSAGILQAYAQAHVRTPGRLNFLLPIYKRMPIHEAVKRFLPADVVGFSTYVWNANISLEIARRLKAARPETLIIFGGPHVPDHPEDFLRTHRFIDVVVHNEGERAFTALLDTYPGRDWSGIPGISYIAPDGSLVRNASGPRIRDLDEVPSPFLTDVFKPLMDTNPGEAWIGLWETNRGCPFQCTFCDWGSATATKVNQFQPDRLMQEVEWFARNKIEFVFCCDANFGILKRDVELAQHVAAVKERTGYPKALSVQNTKNATERAYLTQKILSDAKLNKGVALSMQSLEPTTLANIKRDNISLETYLELQRRFTRDGVETYSDLILGLPGETYESFVAGVDMLMESGQHNRIQFNNLSILPNAEMGSRAYAEKFGIRTVPSAIINIHGSKEALDDDVAEIQDLVVETASLSAEDWRRTRVFAWITAFLHYDKLFQIPIIVAHGMAGLRYRDIIEAFLEPDPIRYPLLHEIWAWLEETASSIQQGGPEYVYSTDWLGIYWPADEYMFIKLTVDGKLGAFYAEAEQLLLALLGDRADDAITTAVHDAVTLNTALVRQPGLHGKTNVVTGSNVMDYYRAVLRGEPAVFETGTRNVVIDRDSQRIDDLQVWCQEVVWYGNKKGAYLYGNVTITNKELAGHY